MLLCGQDGQQEASELCADQRAPLFVLTQQINIHLLKPIGTLHSPDLRIAPVS